MLSITVLLSSPGLTMSDTGYRKRASFVNWEWRSDVDMVPDHLSSKY